MDETGEADGPAIIACGEVSEMLEAAEALFDAVALFVGDRVIRDGDPWEYQEFRVRGGG